MLYKTLVFGGSEYPKLLGEISDAPALIYVRGELKLDRPLIAVVGTRQATTEGKKIAEEFSKELARAGFGIISGLALGIDASAHKGALDAQGSTIAVLGNGIDDIYPPENRELADRILGSDGAIISEYGPGEPIEKTNFIQRNRIISALSIAVLVIEAPIHSGALVTARTGGEQGKDVFVVPGPIGNPNFEGSHKLIRDGAILVSSVEDILEDLNLT
ncbi:MAG: DNA-processing protein DprA [Candidatus Colwellbacteria bacterium]|nr:DNA-processing protein DprA [Candidatus Colwellbacteria bacterium]